MHLATTFPGLRLSFVRPAFLRAPLRTGVLGAAAIAGYLTVLPPQEGNRAGLIGESAEATWTGGIERPVIDTQPSYSAVTSASYLDASASPEVADTKKTALITAPAQPKSSDKAAQRPRRLADETAASPAKASESAGTAGKSSDAGSKVRSADQVIASADPVLQSPLRPSTDDSLPGERAFSSRLLWPGADRLPSSASLLRPFHVVGDAVHNLIRSF
jgi:hypothetical protein